VVLNRSFAARLERYLTQHDTPRRETPQPTSLIISEQLKRLLRQLAQR
jgi:hypothetical protein